VKDFKEFFRNKKITVMGLGLLGRGVGDVAYLAESGADLIVTDLKSAEVLKESLDTLAAFPNIRYTLGRHEEADFKGRDLILKAAGVPLDSSYIEIARKEGAEIAMSGALFAKLSGIPVIGVTGTRGKSTVTHMIHHVLTQVTEGAPVLLGGNVRGVSNLQLLRDVHEDSIAVMELDSWQLQGFGEYKISPHIAVFTNFMEDHMNYYGGDMDAYFADKAHIFCYQEEGGVFITTQAVLSRAEGYMKKVKEELSQEIRLVDSSILPEDCLLAMPGEHNRLNAALATEALRAAGLTDEEIFGGLATFPGVPGRLEYLGEKDGIKIYNDNNATTPQATIQGITALARGKNILLIAGGSYKEVDPAPLIPLIEAHVKNVVLLPGTGTDQLLKALPENSTIDRTISDSMEAAVEAALAGGKEGDVLLFSPGFASFGLFKNEYDRGDQFVDAVRRLL
jgi:UDP-N-acetylmuramoylalanine--D-glutamate ligase